MNNNSLIVTCINILSEIYSFDKNIIVFYLIKKCFFCELYKFKNIIQVFIAKFSNEIKMIL